MGNEKHSPAFWLLAAFFALFVLFMYGPMLVIVVLSFQGPEGGLTFPMRGVSLHWFAKLAEGLGVVDIGAALKRSLGLGLAVMALTVVLSVLAATPEAWSDCSGSASGLRSSARSSTWSIHFTGTISILFLML